MATRVPVAADEPDRRGRVRPLPGAAVVLVECGFAWLPAFLWRFDKALARPPPRDPVGRRGRPSQVVREQVRSTLQPVDGPPDAGALARLLDQLGSDELLLFSTDYPHRQFDGRARRFRPARRRSAGAQILAENARRFYRLGGDASDG